MEVKYMQHRGSKNNSHFVVDKNVTLGSKYSNSFNKKKTKKNCEFIHDS